MTFEAERTIIRPTAGFLALCALAEAQSSLHVSSNGSGQVLKCRCYYVAPLGAFVTAGSIGLSRPTCSVFSPWTGSLLVSSSGTRHVLQYDGNTGASLGVRCCNHPKRNRPWPWLDPDHAARRSLGVQSGSVVRFDLPDLSTNGNLSNVESSSVDNYAFD